MTVSNPRRLDSCHNSAPKIDRSPLYGYRDCMTHWEGEGEFKKYDYGINCYLLPGDGIKGIY